MVCSSIRGWIRDERAERNRDALNWKVNFIPLVGWEFSFAKVFILLTLVKVEGLHSMTQAVTRAPFQMHHVSIGM